MKVNTNKSSYTTRVQSILSEDYRVETPVSAAKDIIAVPNSQGQLEAFSLSSNNQIVYWQQDQDSDAGWIQNNLSIKSNGLGLMNKSDGTQIVIGVNNKDIFELIYNKSTKTFQSLPLGGVGRSFAGTNLIATTDSPDSAVMFFIGLSDSSGSNIGPIWMFRNPDSSQPESTIMPLLFSEGVHFGTFVDISVNPQPYSSYQGIPFICILSDQTVQFGMAQGGIKDGHVLCNSCNLPLSNILDVTFIKNSSGNYEVYYLQSDNSIGFCTQVGIENNMPVWSSPTVIYSGKELNAVDITVVQKENGSLDLFAVSKDSKLWHMQQDTSSNCGWTEIISLGISAAQFSVNRNAEGVAEAFVISSDDHLYNLRQDADSNWNVTEIEQQLSTSECEQFDVYKTDITLYDSDNSTVGAIPLNVTSEKLISVLINNQTYLIDTNNPATVYTNYAGQINIVAETKGLAASKLTVTSDYISGKLSIAPDAETHSYLSTVSSNDLLSGKDPRTGTPVIPEKYQGDVGNVQLAVNRLMNISNYALQNNISADASIHKMSDKTGLITTPIAPTTSLWTIDPDKINQKPWSFSIASGKPVYQDISNEEFNQKLKAAKNTRQSCESTNSFWEDVGSLFESVWEGVTELVEIAVKGATTVITFVLNGITHILDFTFTVLEDLFEAVRGVFDAIGTVLGTVLGWLLSQIGFLFNWDGIKAKRDELVETFTTFFNGLPAAINFDSIKTSVNNYLDNLEENFDSIMTNLEDSTIGKQTAMASYGGKPQEPSSHFDVGGKSYWSSGTWGYDKTMHYGTTSPLLNNNLPQTILTEFQNIIESASEALTDEVMQAFEILQNAFVSWVENPENIANITLDTIFKEIKAAGDILINFIKNLIDSILNILQAMMNDMPQVISWLSQDMDIPFFSAFMKSAGMGNLSPLNLVCLVLAIPLTILSDISNKENTSLIEDDSNDGILIPGIFWVFSYAGVNFSDPDEMELKGEGIMQLLVPVTYGIMTAVATGKTGMPTTNEDKFYWWMGTGLTIFDFLTAMVTTGIPRSSVCITRWIKAVGPALVCIHGLVLVIVAAENYKEVQSPTTKQKGNYWYQFMSGGMGIGEIVLYSKSPTLVGGVSFAQVLCGIFSLGFLMDSVDPK